MTVYVTPERDKYITLTSYHGGLVEYIIDYYGDDSGTLLAFYYDSEVEVEIDERGAWDVQAIDRLRDAVAGKTGVEELGENSDYYAIWEAYELAGQYEVLANAVCGRGIVDW